MENMYDKVQEAIAFVQSKTDFKPQYGIILGTGLGGLVNDIEIEAEISYEDIPHFPVSTVESHTGRLIFGYLSGKAIVAMQGRFHYYEGYSMKQVVFPVYVMKFLGISTVLISNASGSTCTHIGKGDLVFIRDHINLHSENPLRGRNDERIGPRFPDMCEPYNLALIEQAATIAEKHGFTYHKGVYVGLQGPNLETKAEYVHLNQMGGEIVGMSTVPEVIAAVHCGLKVFAVSVATDLGYPPEIVRPLTLEEVIEVAMEAEPKMTTVIRELIEGLKD